VLGISFFVNVGFIRNIRSVLEQYELFLIDTRGDKYRYY
jgi:hypothetical protein